MEPQGDVDAVGHMHHHAGDVLTLRVVEGVTEPPPMTLSNNPVIAVSRSTPS